MAKVSDNRVGKGEATGPQLVGKVIAESGVGVETLDPTLGADWATKVRVMRRDPTLALGRALVTAPVLAAEWSYEANDDAPDDARDFVRSVLDPVRLHLMRHTMNGWLDFGWQGFEKVFQVDDDGRLAVRRLKPLLQDDTDILVEPKTGAYWGLGQKKTDGTDLQLPARQTLLLSHDVEGTDWYGQAIMRRSELAYDQWTGITDAATRYDQRIAGSHWVVYYPLGTSQFEGTETDNFEIAQKILASLKSSGRVAVPNTLDSVIGDLNLQALSGERTTNAWRIEILSDKGTSQSSFVDRMKYLDALKVRGLGFPERAVLEGTYGTKAEAETQGDVAIVLMELRHEMAIQEVNWHLVNQLLRLNWGSGAEGSVWVKPAPIQDEALLFLRDTYTAILSSPDGFLSELTRLDMEALRDRLGIPIVEQGQDDDDLTDLDDVATGEVTDDEGQGGLVDETGGAEDDGA